MEVRWQLPLAAPPHAVPTLISAQAGWLCSCRACAAFHLSLLPLQLALCLSWRTLRVPHPHVVEAPCRAMPWSAGASPDIHRVGAGGRGAQAACAGAGHLQAARRTACIVAAEVWGALRVTAGLEGCEKSGRTWVCGCPPVGGRGAESCAPCLVGFAFHGLCLTGAANFLCAPASCSHLLQAANFSCFVCVQPLSKLNEDGVQVPHWGWRHWATWHVSSICRNRPRRGEGPTRTHWPCSCSPACSSGAQHSVATAQASLARASLPGHTW